MEDQSTDIPWLLLNAGPYTGIDIRPRRGADTRGLLQSEYRKRARPAQAPTVVLLSYTSPRKSVSP